MRAYGLRRVLIDQSGSVKSELTRGEHKSLQTDQATRAGCVTGCHGSRDRSAS